MTHEFLSAVGSVEPFTFCGRGKVWSYTIVTRDNAPKKFEDYTPYVVALVQLEEGPMVTAQITDLDPNQDFNDQVKIGMLVEMITRKLCVEGDRNRGLIIYGPKFRPPIKRQNP